MHSSHLLQRYILQAWRRERGYYQQKLVFWVQRQDNRILVRGRSRFVGPEAYEILETLFKKKNTKLWIKITYKSKYLFGMTQYIRANYKFK